MAGMMDAKKLMIRAAMLTIKKLKKESSMGTCVIK